ncbi:MAG: OadG family protein [Lachnospiraceae bacterium]|nr:OadG family protein [Lachnospiraceae bacterium]
MKKFLLTLALTVMCAFGLTACGNAEKETLSLTSDDAAVMAEGTLSFINEVVLSEQTDEYAKQFSSVYGDEAGKAFASACEIFASASDEFGLYKSVIPESAVVSGTDEEYTVSVEIVGSQRNAKVELYCDAETIFPDMMISPNYTLGEKMSKAALNTLMGMGTVFAVLILIMWIISAFRIIPKIEKSIADKKAKKTSSNTSAAVDNTIAQIIENEELSDDTELVAVIAAAIAASEGAASTDGVVIRSIRRASTNKWQRA